MSSATLTQEQVDKARSDLQAMRDDPDSTEQDVVDAQTKVDEAQQQVWDNPASAGVVPNLLVGTRVKITDGPNAGRMAVVTRVEYKSDEDWAQANTVGHPKRRFANVDYYVVMTRDSKNEQLVISPEDLKALSTTDGWARGES